MWKLIESTDKDNPTTIDTNNLYNLLRDKDCAGYTFNNIIFKNCKIFQEDSFQRQILYFENCKFLRCTFVDLKFYDIYLSNSIFDFCSIINCDFSQNKFYSCKLVNCAITHTDFTDAKIRSVKSTDSVFSKCPSLLLKCPEEGSFIGYKKGLHSFHGNLEFVIIKLQIPAEAKRSSATSLKCRCNKAKVLSIESIHNKEQFTTAVSKYDNSFVYTVGETVSVNNFDENRWNECSTGIHFFINREEAENYVF